MQGVLINLFTGIIIYTYLCACKICITIYTYIYFSPDNLSFCTILGTFASVSHLGLLCSWQRYVFLGRCICVYALHTTCIRPYVSICEFILFSACIHPAQFEMHNMPAWACVCMCTVKLTEIMHIGEKIVKQFYFIIVVSGLQTAGTRQREIKNRNSWQKNKQRRHSQSGSISLKEKQQ